MNLSFPFVARWLLLGVSVLVPTSVVADPPESAPATVENSNQLSATMHPATTAAVGGTSTLESARSQGRARSRFLKLESDPAGATAEAAESTQHDDNLNLYQSTIKPLLNERCVECHGPDSQEGNVRIDTLDPDMLHGADTDWWSEIFAVVSKGEMPPPDSTSLSESEQRSLVEWLSAELQTASTVRRRSVRHSTFRRMTSYETNYALQDLLGVPWDFAKDLPPESQSAEGFENSSDLLHFSLQQFETYQRLARHALARVTVAGDQPPTLHWCIPMHAAAAREWPKQEQQLLELKKELKDDPPKLEAELEKLQQRFMVPPQAAYYKDLSSSRIAKAEWDYPQAAYAFEPSKSMQLPTAGATQVAILPNGAGSRLTIELGNQLPDEGTMRVVVWASQASATPPSVPSLQLLFGWQASNEGRALLRVSNEDVPITSESAQPQVVQWDVPLGEIYPRNSVRKTSPMGAIPSPSEYIRLVNTSVLPSEIQIEYVQVSAPVYEQWPPASHRRIFAARSAGTEEAVYARHTIEAFTERAWRRPLTDQELTAKLRLFESVRPQCATCEEAILEVLATVLASPQFLYVTARPDSDAFSPSAETPESRQRQAYALANRLALFLWCSIPDEELLLLAESSELLERPVLAAQVQRLLNDPRSQRLAKHFVHQWLDLQLLEYQNFKQHVPDFDPLLQEAMEHEPVALFREILSANASLLDFLHCDYAMVNERLAAHYGIDGVVGNHFRRVPLTTGFRRGGLLTQAGLLAMNSDWPDSHPLKRAIWLLESVMADPPPPPPPAVPQIDVADPAIAKMTLKERIENHRNHAACLSCHIKIDPWGIAFENYDALGRWRDEIAGKPIDASSKLFNGQTLSGMDGLKYFLLQNRQDQFVEAMLSKLTTYALGRPLSFADRAALEAMTTHVRQQGDGLRTAIETIVLSELFLSP